MFLSGDQTPPHWAPGLRSRMSVGLGRSTELSVSNECYDSNNNVTLEVYTFISMYV